MRTHRPTTRVSPRYPGRAFTLAELMVVIVMVSLLAAVVSPGLGAIRGTQQAAGTAEVARMLRTAQQLARASGRPHGLWMDADTERVRLVRLTDEGSVQPALDGLGQNASTRSLADDFSGLDVMEIDPGTGLGVTSTTLWFDYLGHPEIRDADGSNARAATTEPTVFFTGYDPIEIDRITGVLR